MNPKIIFFLSVLIGVSLACSLPVASPPPVQTLEPTQNPSPQSQQTAEAQTQVAVMTEAAFFEPGTPLPEPTVPASFSVEQANPVPPSDVLEEVSFFVEGGGGSVICSDTLELCEVNSRGIPGQIEWLKDISLVIGGGEADSDVQIRIYGPDNRILPDSGKRSWRFVGEEELIYAFSYSFYVSSEMPIGDYRFIFTFPNGEVETSVNVFRPSIPSLRVSTPENKILLFNFAPHESVRLLAYKRLEETTTLRFAGWDVFAMDATGALSLERPQADTGNTYYFAIGEQSGPVSGNGLELKESLLKP